MLEGKISKLRISKSQPKNLISEKVDFELWRQKKIANISRFDNEEQILDDEGTRVEEVTMEGNPKAPKYQIEKSVQLPFPAAYVQLVSNLFMQIHQQRKM